MLNEAYTADGLEAQLTTNAKVFFANRGNFHFANRANFHQRRAQTFADRPTPEDILAELDKL